MKNLKNKKLSKTFYEVGKSLLKIGFICWQFETLIFLYIYGWHWKAFNEIEQVFDKACAYMLFGGIICYCVSFLFILDEFYEKK